MEWYTDQLQKGLTCPEGILTRPLQKRFKPAAAALGLARSSPAGDRRRCGDDAAWRAAGPGNDPATARVASSRITETMMTKTTPPIPEDNRSHKGPGSAPSVPLDTTKGHRDDEKHNIREQGDHGNMTQNTSNRRSG